MVKGVSSGTAVIQISNGTNTEQRTVRVNIPKLNKSGIKIKENSTFSLSLAGLRADWSSNNRKVAVVSNTGIVTGKNELHYNRQIPRVQLYMQSDCH